MRISSARSVSAIFRRPTVRPLRNTKTSSHSASTSSSLWLINSTPQPSSANRFSKAKSERASPGVNTEVGSSKMSRRGDCNKQRKISTRCFSPADKSLTRRDGSMLRSYFSDKARKSPSVLAPKAMFRRRLKIQTKQNVEKQYQYPFPAPFAGCQFLLPGRAKKTSGIGGNRAI